MGTASQHSIGIKKSQSALSLWLSCSAPSGTRQRAATALPRTPPSPVHGRDHAQARLLLRPHSQTSAFRGTLRERMRATARLWKTAPDGRFPKRRQPTAIFHPCDQTRAPATKPAAEALPALVMHFASWVTWLEGVTPRASDRMCGLPPAIVSASWRERQNWPFRGSEYRSYPLPFDHRFSPLLGPFPGSQTAFFSASSPKTLTGKPLRAFHG